MHRSRCLAELHSQGRVYQQQQELPEVACAFPKEHPCMPIRDYKEMNSSQALKSLEFLPAVLHIQTTTLSPDPNTFTCAFETVIN